MMDLHDKVRTCLIALCLALSMPASAADSGADEAAVRKAYSDGVAAYRLGKYDDAAKHFETSYQLGKMPMILFDLAQAYRKSYETDHNVDALGKSLNIYKAFLRDASTTPDKRAFVDQLLPKLERQLQEENRRLLQERLAKAVGQDGVFLAKQLATEGKFREAGQVLDRVLSVRGNTRDVVISALEVRADVGARTRESDVAVEAYRRLILLQPGYRIAEEAGPQSVDAFKKAEASLKGARPLHLTHVPVGQFSKHEPVRVQVSIDSDPLHMVERFEVYYRTEGGGAFSPASVEIPSGSLTASVEIPMSFVSRLRGGSRVEYYAVGKDGLDGEMFSLGTPQRPYVASATPDLGENVPGAPKKPLYKRAWFWGTLVSVAAVVGAGIGLGVYFGTLNNPQEVSAPTTR